MSLKKFFLNKCLKSILFGFFLFGIHSCNSKKENQSEHPFLMNSVGLSNNNYEKEILELKNSMISYLNFGDPSYNKKDVDDCINIIENYVDEISKTNSKTEGMNIVEATIKKLNALNQKTNFSLIETNEREQIALIIIAASAQKGYNSMEEDITEVHREW